ncbi:MAG: AAC(3) family N-acetyltransferase [Candidatus Aureabacteria bacterium]|nr:AAC(3) family N-acetyltransferase [Candidatus Auribacterota bacterium]
MFKEIIKKILPNFIKTRIKNFLDKKRRTKRKNERIIIESTEFAGFLNKFELKGDFDVIFHSSTSHFPKIKGGVKEIFDCLQSWVKSGNILVPTFPFTGRVKEYLTLNNNFNVIETPSQMGAFTEYFRKLEKVIRSEHPTHPVSVLGPLAAYYTEDHIKGSTPFGNRSPFYKLAQNKGYILLMGVDLNSVTGFHVHEDMLGSLLPYSVYEKNLMGVSIIKKDGSKIKIQTPVHDVEMSKKRDCERLRDALVQNNAMKIVKVYNSSLSLIDAHLFNRVLIKELLNGNSIYGKVLISDIIKEKINNYLQENLNA